MVFKVGGSVCAGSDETAEDGCVTLTDASFAVEDGTAIEDGAATADDTAAAEARLQGRMVQKARNHFMMQWMYKRGRKEIVLKGKYEDFAQVSSRCLEMGDGCSTWLPAPFLYTMRLFQATL